MKNTIKKWFGLFLIVAALVGTFSVSAFAADSFSPDGDPLTYTVLPDESLMVTDCEGGQQSITIPDKVQGKNVTRIKDGLLNSNTSLETLTFADGCGIETIQNSFNDCVNLKEINWGTGGSLKEITESFHGCASLESLSIPASVETIGKKSFANCIKLSELNFAKDSKLSIIDKEAFAFLGKTDEVIPAAIDTLTLPASLETLDESAFHCIPVKKFALEDNSKLQEIPGGFLAAEGADGNPGTDTDCYYLFDYALNKFINFTEPYPFTPGAVAKACDCLTSVDLGDGNSLTIIGAGAFKNQTHLSSLDFGTKAKSDALTIRKGAFIAMANNAFANQNGETMTESVELVFPSNLTTIENGAFSMAQIKSVTFGEKNSISTIGSNVMGIDGQNAYPSTDPLSKAANCLESIDFGTNNALTSIGYGSFRNQSHLTKLNFGTVTGDLKIEYGAFTAAGNNAYLVNENIDSTLNDGLETVVFPANLTKIGEGAFTFARIKNMKFSEGCKLTEIPNAFMQIGGMNTCPDMSPAAIAANSLETLTFGKNNSFVTIKSGAFGNQNHLTTIDFGTSSKDLTIQSGAFTAAGNNQILVKAGHDTTLNEIQKLVFPSNLAVLREGCFQLARIKNMEFSENCKLTTIPSSFMQIGGSNAEPATYDTQIMGGNCLESVNFGKNNSLTTINYGAFGNQSYLTSLDFGTGSNNLTIQSGAFVGVGNNGYLIGADYSKLNAGIEKLVFPANLAEMNTGCFMYARIKNIEFSENCRLKKIPSNFMQIGGSNSAPATYLPEAIGSDCLESVKFGTNNSLTNIGYGAFGNQNHLTTLDFGTGSNNLTIESGAFAAVGNNAALVNAKLDSEMNAGIETLVFPANLAAINEGCFQYARIKNMEFSDNCRLKTISSGFMQVGGSNGYPSNSPADMGANYLESVNFGKNNSITTIYYGAFGNQNHMKSIDFGTGSEDLTILYGAFVGVGNNAYLVKSGIDSELNEGIQKLVLPSRLSSLNEGCFQYARISKIRFRDNCKLESIPNAFMAVTGEDGKPGVYEYLTEAEKVVQEGADSLTEVDFGENNSLKVIYSGAFKNHTGLTFISFGNNADGDTLTLYPGAFTGTAPETLTIPANIAFYGDGQFKKAKVKNLVFEDGCTLTALPGGFLSKDFDDPSDEPTLETIDFGKNSSLTSIGSGVFAGNKNLKTLDLSDTKVDTISNGAFNDCGLKTITLPATLTNLSEGAFQELSDLETLTIGSDCALTTLTGGVVSNCEKLTTLDLLNSNITTIGDSVKNNVNLTTIIFPEKLKSIEWEKEDEELEEPVPEIESLEEEEPVEETEIEDAEICPFYGCTSVNKLVFASTDPSDYSIDEGSLQFLNNGVGIVYVPEATTEQNIQAYKTVLENGGLSFEEGQWTIQNTSYEAYLANVSKQKVAKNGTFTAEVYVKSASPIAAAQIDLTVQNGTITSIAGETEAIGVNGSSISFSNNTADVTAGYKLATVTVEADDSGNDVVLSIADSSVVTLSESDSAAFILGGNARATVLGLISDRVSCAEYVNVSGKYLVKYTGAVPEGNVATYNGQAMLYSDQYAAWFTILDEDTSGSLENKNVTLARGTKETVTNTGDVNQNGKINIMDAQISYDIATGVFSDYSVASLPMWIGSDVNGNGTVDASDPRNIQNTIHGIAS